MPWMAAKSTWPIPRQATFAGRLSRAVRPAAFMDIEASHEIIVFQLGVQDAEVLAEQLGGDLTARNLMALPRFQTCAQLLINGHPSRPFAARAPFPFAFAAG